MLLQSIKLTNFRQFRNEYIEFADGKDGKNVTIILGENGTGKTTFAQAFFWCLYGETEFADKSLLNKMVAAEMRPGQEEKVKVELNLHHGEIDYTLIREQIYRKDLSNKIKAESSIFDIATKDDSGNTAYIKKTQCESEVKKILPKELSKYFFFDGERIERMSKDISTGRKATDFAEAVKGLLGLNAMYSAIQHFNPRIKSSVISSYENSYNAQSNEKIKAYTEKIENCNKKIDEIENRVVELAEEIDSANARKIEKSTEIKQYEEGEKLQEEKDSLIKKISNIEKTRSSTYKIITDTFNANLSSFFSIFLIDDALQLLSKKDIAGKDIPYMHSKTIEYLLQQKVCICGTHLDEGTMPYNKVKELINFLPPQSISTTIGDFKKESLRRIKNLNNVCDSIEDSLGVISQQDDELIDLNDDLANVESKLSGGDVRDMVRSINNEIQRCDKIIKDDGKERDSLIAEKAKIENEKERADTERRNLTLLDENNKKIEIYREYANRIYKELQEVYMTSEENIRERLQTTINDIFKQIYEGGLYLTIDEKYHISVYATNYDGGVETSTAQSISVIFAFIAGIIKMARDNKDSTNADEQLLSSETYPLVMDAPLSAFDKRRIKTVCEALPKVAEQVIIFIKDTDGDLAENYMGSRVGSKHHFIKKNEFETSLVEEVCNV